MASKVKKVSKKVVKKSSAKSQKTNSKVSVAPASKLSMPSKAYGQSQLIQTISEQAEITRSQARLVIATLQQLATLHLNKKGPGQFTIPGVLKIVAANKPATKARKGRNPATGETITIKAKPARRVIKARILKKFKTAVL